ncbi:MAG: polyamine aminopropyltransferase [Gammaproteobacteria bacterium]|nr:polyamine aminopropyltransferase [Gammaproteobacteria bacterium]
MSLDKNWFTEEAAGAGCALSLKIVNKIHEEQTPYQLLEIYQTETFGNLMTLDGLVMLTDRDNFIYHEMMAHPALFSHPDPKKVLIIGGGDCGSLLEVLKHSSVTHADQVELDERVTRVSERFFPDLCKSNNDPRAHLHFTDGIKWIEECAPETYDVIIIDSTDPVGPAEGLFTSEFYHNCLQALGPQGVIVAQSESPLIHAHIITKMHKSLHDAGFVDTATLQFAQCSYPSGWWSATMGCKQGSLSDFRAQDAAGKRFATRYYNADIHQGALAQPEFLRNALDKNH